MATTKKAKFIIKSTDDKELLEFYSKNATALFNKLEKGTNVKLSIEESGYAEQFVGDYIVKGLEEGEEPGPTPEPGENKPPIIDITTPIEALVDSEVNMIAHVADPDGTIEDTTWIQTAGETVQLTISEVAYSASFKPTKSGDYKFRLDVVDNQGATTSKEILVTVTETEPEEPPIPEPEPTGVLWDSNKDGKWDDGNKRTITVKQGSQKPNDKSIFVAASGSPKLEIDGDGVAHLVAGSGEAENLSLKLRSRHQAGGDCANRFGGFGCSFDRSSIDMKTESCHNFHENSMGASIPSIKNDEWHKWRFDCKDTDDKKVRFDVWLDDKLVKTGFHNNPKAYYLAKKTFEDLSWFWIRINNSDHGRIYVCACNYNASLSGEWKFEAGKPSVALRNVKLVAI